MPAFTPSELNYGGLRGPFQGVLYALFLIVYSLQILEYVRRAEKSILRRSNGLQAHYIKAAWRGADRKKQPFAVYGTKRPLKSILPLHGYTYTKTYQKGKIRPF